MLKQNDKEYKKYINKKIGIIVILFVIMISMSVFSVSMGSFNIEPLDVFKALFGKASQQINMIVLSVRMPRVAMAIISGIGLALSGCVMQSVLKNPLASASTLGISQGAAFGAAFAIVCLGAGQSTTLISTDSSLTITNPYMTTVSAFICSMLTVLIIIGLSKSRDNSPSSMVLAGVALSAMFSGGTALMQYFGTDTEIASIVFWTFGDLGRVTWKEIGIVSVVVLITSVYLILNSWNYNAISEGTHTAKGLGVNVEAVRFLGMAVSSLSVATIVSFVGIINFIGLIAPHAVAALIGRDNKYLMPASALMGAVLILLSDGIARMVISPIILPIGAITSFMGAPLFLYILRKGGAKGD